MSAVEPKYAAGVRRHLNQLCVRRRGVVLRQPALDEASLLGRDDAMPLHIAGGVAIFTQKICTVVQNVDLVLSTTANTVIVGVDDVALLHLIYSSSFPGV